MKYEIRLCLDSELSEVEAEELVTELLEEAREHLAHGEALALLSIQPER